MYQDWDELPTSIQIEKVYNKLDIILQNQRAINRRLSHISMLCTVAILFSLFIAVELQLVYWPF